MAGLRHASIQRREQRDDRIVEATPALDEYRPPIASAIARAQVGVSRPEGFAHTPPTVAIEGVEELVDALRAA